MTFDLTPIIEALFGLLATVVSCLLVPYIRSKTSAAQQEELNGWVRLAVAAAEQVYQGQGRGQEKLAYVETWLARRGITVDTDKIKAMIEAAVYELTSDGLLVETVTDVSDLTVEGPA